MATTEQLQRLEVPPKAEPNHRRSEVRPHLRDALALLLQAYEYALELGQDVWDLAVELEVLRASKLTNSDIRWLAAKEYVEHAVEITGPDDTTRHFRRTPLLTFSEGTCLVLTRAGAMVARETRYQEAAAAAGSAAPAIFTHPSIVDPAERPRWDQQRRQLRVGDELVKEFKLPSPNQETVLMALEEDGWPPRIDDPLPPKSEVDPRRRLHDTIKALNGKQKQRLIRFMGDGSGEGIRWELTGPADAQSASDSE